MKFTKGLNFDDKGLIPAVIQDYKTKQVLTLCYMSKEALETTLKEGKIYVFRRSKGRVMLKGETSGCIQTVKAVYKDCADNSVLFLVSQKRAACHEGYFTCYFRKIDKSGETVTVGKRVFNPDEVY